MQHLKACIEKCKFDICTEICNVNTIKTSQDKKRISGKKKARTQVKKLCRC